MKQGFLKPLSIPDRIWQKISIDFIVVLLESEGCLNIIVITNRLSKDVSLAALLNLEVEMVV